MFSCEKTKKELENNKVLQTENSLADLNWIRMQTKQGDITCPLFLKRGSLTVEAALTLPLFLLACLTLLSLVDVMKTTTHKHTRQLDVLRSTAVYASLLSGVAEGQEGDCISYDYVYAETLPIGGFGLKKVLVRQRSMVHLFNGYDDSRGDTIDERQDYVYITEQGSVYHTKRTCQAICVSVQEVSGRNVGQERNTEGKIYRKCSYCAKGYTKKELNRQKLYITDYGVKYHVRPNCPELIRVVQVVRKESIGGRTPCKFCG